MLKKIFGVVINPQKEKGGLTPAVITTMSIYFIRLAVVLM
jgi:hypothetical protein